VVFVGGNIRTESFLSLAFKIFKTLLIIRIKIKLEKCLLYPILGIVYVCVNGFSSVKQVQIPRATVGPDEPHAASTTWPDGIADKQDSSVYDNELEQIEAFLSSELPSHPKLHRGQLKNGLRYLILPNKVPPKRQV